MERRLRTLAVELRSGRLASPPAAPPALSAEASLRVLAGARATEDLARRVEDLRGRLAAATAQASADGGPAAGPPRDERDPQTASVPPRGRLRRRRS
jgi:hypothetical protein